MTATADSADGRDVEYRRAWDALCCKPNDVIHFIYALSASLVLQLAHTITSAYLVLHTLRYA